MKCFNINVIQRLAIQLSVARLISNKRHFAHQPGLLKKNNPSQLSIRQLQLVRPLKNKRLFLIFSQIYSTNLMIQGAHQKNAT